jgi:Fe/S biogenesis protein NfuA
MYAFGKVALKWSDAMLVITETAKEKIQSVMESQGRSHEGLRLGIVGRRMSSFQYSLGLVEPGQEADDDVVFDAGEFKVYMDPGSAPNLEGVTIDYVENIQGSGFKIDNPNPLWTDPQHMAVQELFDTRINPNLASHGGFVDLLEVKDDTVYVRLGGGCQGCGMVDVTLKHGIVAMIKEEFPEIDQVIDTTDHASGQNPYYQPGKG